MITPELVSYVRGEMAKGITKDIISTQLKTQGWADADVSEVFAVVSPIAVSPIAANPTASFHGSSVQPVLEPVRSHKKVFILSGIAVLLLICISIFGYASGYFVSFQKMFAQSLQATHDAKSSTLDFNLTIDASGLKNQDSFKELPGMSNIFNFSMKGSSDVSDPKNIKADIKFTLTSGTLEADISTRILNETLYAELTKSPELPFFSLKPYENKWISFPYSADRLKNDPLLSSSGLGNSVFKTLTDDQKKHIYDITENAQIIKVTNKHLPEMKDGSLVAHFDFDIDQPGIVAYLKELAAYIKTIDKDNTYDLGSINDSDYTDMFKPLKNFHGEAWIGAFNHLPYGVNINIDMQDPENPSDGIVKFALTMAYTNWNKQVIVEAPKDTTTIEKLMEGVMGGTVAPAEGEQPTILDPQSSLENAQKKSEDAMKKSILANMRAQAELYHENSNNSYSGFCKSKGQDGAYVLAKTFPANTTYKCNDSVSKWAAWAKLSSTTDYWCADSNSFFNTIGSVPPSNKTGGTSCSLDGSVQ